MKNIAYNIKEAIKGLFSYPRTYIEPSSSNDYNSYWKDKRGHNIGNLSIWQKERADIILETLARERTPFDLADVGCGDGSILLYLKNNLPIVTSCVGYDSSDFALTRAKELGIQTSLLDITEKKSYKMLVDADYYLMLEVLEHIPHSEEFMLHILSKARKGVFFSFPNTGYIKHRVRLLFGKFPLQWRIFPNEHVRFWTHADLKWWLRALGIKNYHVHCYRGVPLLNRVLPSIFAAGFIVYIRRVGDK